jgi:PAS domain S-box-containing protein
LAERKKNRSPQKLPALSRRELVARLSEAEETLRAIRSDEVDAIVVNGQGGKKVFTLQGADHAYRVFVERMNEGAAVLSSDHTVLHCNVRFARFVGAGLQSVIGSSMLDLVWPDDHPKLDALLRRAAQRNCRGEIRLQSRKGAPLSVQLSLNPLRLDSTRALCLIASDLSEIKRTEQELRASSDQAQKSGEYARAIVGTIHEALVVVDSECRVVTVNRSFCNLFRVSLQGMEHQSFFGLGAGQCNVPLLRELLQDILSKGIQIKDFELDQDFPEIGRRRLVLNARQIDESKTILIAIEDFTERKQAQEEAEKSQSTIRALLESTPQSVVAVSADEKIVLANGNTEKMFGYSREELLGQPLEILVPENVRARHVKHRRAYFANMQSRPMAIGLNLVGRRKDGTNFPVEIGLSAIETAAGKLAVAFVSDITQRRQLEEAGRARGEEIQALAASLLTAQEEERRRVSRELHDQICQQLASLAIDIGGLAADPPPPEDAQSRLKALQARVVKASEETRHIAYQLHPSVLDDLGLVASLRGLCKEFSERATNIALECTDVPLPASVPRELASCLYRVAQESLQNIAKHASAKHVSVALTLQKGTVVLTIADDGAGFDQEAVKGRGGLGLIGMKERARLVNGKLSFAAQPGHGTRIALQVPLPAGSSL